MTSSNDIRPQGERMNKTVVLSVGVVVLAGAVVVGATAWSGQKIEARYHEQLTRAQARLPFLRVSEDRYDKGFFTSTATTTVQFGCPTPGDAERLTATITSTIHHGPVAAGTLAAAVIDSQLHLSGGAAQPLATAFSGAPLTVHTVVGFTGKASSTFASPAARLPIGAGGEVAWQGLSGSLEESRDARSVSYRMTSPGLTITDPKTHASVRVGAIAVQGDGRIVADDGMIMVGKSRGTLDSIEIADAGAEPLKVGFTGMSFVSETAINDDLLSGTGTFSGAGSVGDVRIDRFEMQTSMQRIHAPTYQRLMATASREIYRCDSKDKMADLLGLQDKLKGDLIAMLRYSPAMSVDKLAVQSGGQTGEISYGFGVDGVTEADAQLPPVQLLMAHLNAKASARVPIEWLRKVSQSGAARLRGKAPDPAAFDLMLDQASAQGFLVRDSAYVKSSVVFTGGVLKVNGKVIGPPQPKTQ